MRGIYEIPETIKELFENKECSYRIVDYSIKGMDNIEALQYFCDLVEISDKNIVYSDTTEMVVSHTDYDYKIHIDSHGGGDEFKHQFDVSIYEDDSN